MAASKSSGGHPWLKRIVIALIAAVAASVVARRKALAPAPQFDLQLSARPEPPAPPSPPAKPDVSPPVRLVTPDEPASAEVPAGATADDVSKPEATSEASETASSESTAEAAASGETGADASATEELDDLEEDEAESDAGLPVADDPVSAALNSGAGYLRMTDGERNCPEAFPIKGNASSHIYHRPGESSYEATIPEICFADEAIADSMGYRPRKH